MQQQFYQLNKLWNVCIFVILKISKFRREIQNFTEIEKFEVLNLFWFEIKFLFSGDLKLSAEILANLPFDDIYTTTLDELKLKKNWVWLFIFNIIAILLARVV